MSDKVHKRVPVEKGCVAPGTTSSFFFALAGLLGGGWRGMAEHRDASEYMLLTGTMQCGVLRQWVLGLAAIQSRYRRFYIGIASPLLSETWKCLGTMLVRAPIKEAASVRAWVVPADETQASLPACTWLGRHRHWVEAIATAALRSTSPCTNK